MKPTSYRIRDDMQGVYFSAFVGIAFGALFSLIVLIWSLGQSGTPAVAGLTTGLIGLVGCGIAAVIGIRLIQRAPTFAICVDDEGIWHEHWGRKEGLVKWDAVRGVRRRRGQRLELLDEHGAVLVRLHPQLHAYGELTETIAERATQVRALDKSGKPGADDCPLRPPSVYHCRPIRYYGFMGMLAFFLAVALRRIPDFRGLWDGAFMGLLALLFWRGRFVRRIEITPEHLDLRLLSGHARLTPDDIGGIEMQDVSLTGPLYGFFSWLDFTGIDSKGVVITTHDGARRFALYDMGVHPEDLARRLNTWRDASSAQDERAGVTGDDTEPPGTSG